MERDIIILLLITFIPIYTIWMFYGLRKDKRLRMMSSTTRFEYIKELGDILLSWRVVLWLYLLIDFFEL